MASVLPKVKLYSFISIICLLINIGLFMSSLFVNPNTDSADFLGSETKNIYYSEVPEYENKTIGQFAVATGGSFVPFYSLLTISDNVKNLPPSVTVIVAIVVAIIGAYQIFLLTIIILNMLPKILSSGFDV